MEFDYDMIYDMNWNIYGVLENWRT